MDYLDPEYQRSHRRRLITGYLLVAIVIGLATYLISAGANGYGFNLKTRKIVQNGLLFVDSQPGGAKIYLNGNDQNAATAARLVLTAGNYTLTLKKDGYRDWSRKFYLSEQSVARYVYPFLFPDKPKLTNLKSYASQPQLITQSPDQKWLLIENSAESSKTPTFDQYDTTTLDNAQPAVTTLTMPANLLTSFSAGSTLVEVEWSTNNNQVLLKHTYAGGSEFVVFDRNDPAKSFNVNALLAVAPAGVSLYNKSADKLYIYSANGDLSLADTGSKTVAAPILKRVLAYKPYGRDIVSFVTDGGQPAGKVAGNIYDSGKIYAVNNFAAGSVYLVDAAEFQNHFYFVDGSDKSDRVIIYKDPVSTLKNASAGAALPIISLHNPGSTKLKFSNNARFIGTEAGQKFAVYDIETQTSYQYPLSNPLAANMDWMDGHRFIGQSGGSILVMDYDGTNKQIVTPTVLPSPKFFSSNYNHLMTLVQSEDKTAYVLQNVDMRAGNDLPKQ
jgi:hypothetical protein